MYRRPFYTCLTWIEFSFYLCLTCYLHSWPGCAGVSAAYSRNLMRVFSLWLFRFWPNRIRNAKWVLVCVECSTPERLLQRNYIRFTYTRTWPMCKFEPFSRFSLSLSLHNSKRLANNPFILMRSVHRNIIWKTENTAISFEIPFCLVQLTPTVLTNCMGCVGIRSNDLEFVQT